MMTRGGARLAFVVVKLKGTVKREVTRWQPFENGKRGGQLVKEVREEPAGYMVYCPRGHCFRLRDDKELEKYRLDRRPKIINLQGLADPNSALGKMMQSQDEKARIGAYQDMEKMVIRLATAKSGNLLMPEQVGRRPRMVAAVESDGAGEQEA